MHKAKQHFKNRSTPIAKTPEHPLVSRNESAIYMLQRTIGNQATQSLVQRSIFVGKERKPYSAEDIWNLLVQEMKLPAIAKSEVLSELIEWDKNDEEFESLEEVVEELGGYELEVLGVHIFFEFNEGEDVVEGVKKLIIGIQEKYGITLDSAYSFKAISTSLELNKDDIGERQYQKRMEKLKEDLVVESWTVGELEALAGALKHFAPILGVNRASSPRAGVPQEITSFGKVNRAVDFSDTLAETFLETNHIILYEEGLNQKGRSPSDNEKRATLVHELTHGFLEHRLKDFKQHVPYWQWVDEQEAREETEEGYKRGKYHGESPPTGVAKQAVHEDLAESVMLYFTLKEKFKAKFPQRFQAVEHIIREEFGQ